MTIEHNPHYAPRNFGDRFAYAFVRVLRFFADRGSTSFVEFSLDRLATSKAFQGFPDPALSQARGFALISTVRGKVSFCVGEYVPNGREAYVVTRCAPYPQSTPVANELARRQLEWVTAGSAP